MRGFFFLTVVALFVFAVYTPPKPVSAPTSMQAAAAEQPVPDVTVWDGESGIPADVVVDQPEEVPTEEPASIVVEEESTAPEEVPAETVEVVTEEPYVPEPIVEDPVLVIPEEGTVEESSSEQPTEVPHEEVNIVEELIGE